MKNCRNCVYAEWKYKAEWVGPPTDRRVRKFDEEGRCNYELTVIIPASQPDLLMRVERAKGLSLPVAEIENIPIDCPAWEALRC